MKTQRYIAGLVKHQMVYLRNIKKTKTPASKFNLEKMFSHEKANKKVFSNTSTTELFNIIRVLPHGELMLSDDGTFSVG